VNQVAGVSIRPDWAKTISIGGVRDYNHTINNTGNGQDIIQLRTVSSQGWNITLYNDTNNNKKVDAGDEIMAWDTNGDGDYLDPGDYINPAYNSSGKTYPNTYPDTGVLGQFEEFYIIVRVRAPLSATEGMVDVTVLNGTSNFDNTVWDNATDTSTVSITENKTLYLHLDGTAYILNTTVGVGAGQSITLSTAEYRLWNQTPEFALNFDIRDDVHVYLYIVPTQSGTSWPDVTVNLTYDGTGIGETTIDDISASGWYDFLIPVVTSVTIPAGNKLILNVSVSSEADTPSATVWYDSATYDSHINLTTSTFIAISEVKTYNLAVVERTLFSDGEPVVVRANVTDPLGAYDIAGANLTIRAQPSGAVLVDDVPMSVEASGTEWKRFVYTWTNMPQDFGDDFDVEVTARESNGVIATASTIFTVPVVLSPDYYMEGIRGKYRDYAHNLTYNRSVADVIDFEVYSSEGWNVTLYNDTNGNGLVDTGEPILSWDADGDGTWEQVYYDTNLNGKPDTGLMTENTYFNIIVRIRIPYSASLVVDYLEIYAILEDEPTVNGTANDTTMQVPQIVLNEVGSYGSIEYEWVEIYNNDTLIVNLADWNITDQDGNVYSLANIDLAPGSYVVINTTSGTNTSTRIYLWSSVELWDDTGDDMVLLYRAFYADYMAYKTPAATAVDPCPSNLSWIRDGLGADGNTEAPANVNQAVELFPNGVDRDHAIDWYLVGEGANNAPVLVSYSLTNATGMNKLNAQLDVNRWYNLTVNITDLDGFRWLDEVNITFWFDNGSDATYGSYESIPDWPTYKFNLVWRRATDSFSIIYPTTGEVELGTTPPYNSRRYLSDDEGKGANAARNATFIFWFRPREQMRYAPGDGSWNLAEGLNDNNSWNFNITVTDFDGLSDYAEDEFGVYRYCAMELVSGYVVIGGENWTYIEGPHGFNATTNMTMGAWLNITFSTNYNYTLNVTFYGYVRNLTTGQYISRARFGVNWSVNGGSYTQKSFSGSGSSDTIWLIGSETTYAPAPTSGTSQFVLVAIWCDIPRNLFGGIYVKTVANENVEFMLWQEGY
jgi:hypothetical protein